MRNPSVFHAPLQPRDTEKQTSGCRHTNPEICANNRVPKKCAFVNVEGICYAPPASWPKQFQKLKEAATATTMKKPTAATKGTKTTTNAKTGKGTKAVKKA